MTPGNNDDWEDDGAEYLAFVERLLWEWLSGEDEEAYRDL